MKYLVDPFKKMFEFQGKSTNKEFWIFFTVNIILFTALGFLRNPLNIPLYVGDILRVILCIPTLALGFRRLNDAGINKWLFLIPFVNLILAGLPEKKQTLS
ncbi:DUF805 domain-containing protein [Cellulophaga sp. Hel_I_12]|uniref:DUF805 domain-containing protein n=1 Tax=Cellulophaga sp. Hel_I_12 TaxID=1249972 RepID=UPI0006489D6C|nr:DUF805 domain-containing protein [Cellulophaga sp. Hel_I_12]